MQIADGAILVESMRIATRMLSEDGHYPSTWTRDPRREHVDFITCVDCHRRVGIDVRDGTITGFPRNNLIFGQRCAVRG